MRKLLVTLVVLVALLVAADFTLRYIATRQIGQALADRLQLAEPPSVSTSGFPFLTQAINGQYDPISATLPNTQLGPLGNVSVDVDLLGVRLPLSDALSGDVSTLTADSGQVRIDVPVQSIADAVGLPDLRITAAPNGGLQLAATVAILGQQFPVAAQLDASVVDNALQLRSGSVSGAGLEIPAEVVTAIGSLVSIDLPLSELPFTIERATVSSLGNSLVVDATTTGLAITGSR